jgi:hypothetical protein
MASASLDSRVAMVPRPYKVWEEIVNCKRRDNRWLYEQLTNYVASRSIQVLRNCLEDRILKVLRFTSETISII